MTIRRAKSKPLRSSSHVRYFRGYIHEITKHKACNEKGEKCILKHLKCLDLKLVNWMMKCVSNEVEGDSSKTD
jgi:hypothetical protein